MSKNWLKIPVKVEIEKQLKQKMAEIVQKHNVVEKALELMSQTWEEEVDCSECPIYQQDCDECCATADNECAGNIYNYYINKAKEVTKCHT